MDDKQCAYRSQADKCVNKKYRAPVGSLEKTFKDHGKATLVFENCNNRGSVQIFLNNNSVQIQSASANNFHDKGKTVGKEISIAEFKYSPDDVLEVKEVDGATIKISSLNSTSRKYFLSIRAIILSEMIFFIFGIN